MSRRFTPAQIEEFTERLRSELPPGASVATQVLHVSRSGMSREIGAYIVRDGEIVNISWEVAAITGQRYGQRGGVIVGGAGMDMTFHLVYGLSRRLYPEGHRCTGHRGGYTPSGKRAKHPRCPSNDHSNDYGRLAREYDAAHADDEARLNDHSASDERARRQARVDYVSARQEWIAAQEPHLWSKRRKHSDGGYAIVRVSL
jgi:hypothetical protein